MLCWTACLLLVVLASLAMLTVLAVLAVMLQTTVRCGRLVLCRVLSGGHLLC